MNQDFNQMGLAWLEEYRKQFIKIMGRKTHAWFDHPVYKEHVQTTKRGKRIFIDNGSNVLFVGHLDTVHDGPKWAFHWNPGKDKAGQDIVMTTTVDDRLGVATALILFPLLGIKCDILLTEGEEKGQSTAMDFTPPEGKVYNWIMELDRSGSGLNKPDSDVVLYEYKDAEWTKTLTEAGFISPGTGSFTDICELQKLGCKAMNVAIGYYDNHSRKAWFNVQQWARSVMLVKNFYDQYKDTRFPHTEVKRKTYSNSYYDYDSGRSWYNSWAEGMVVRTSPHSRKDKQGKIGVLGNNWRRDMFLVISNEGFVVDVVAHYDILSQVKCDNCLGKMVNNYFPEGNCIYCEECVAILDLMPDDIRAYVTNGGRYVDYADGMVISMDCFVPDGMVLVMGKTILGIVPFHELIVPSGGMMPGNLVRIIFDSGVVSDQIYEVMETDEKIGQAAICQPGSNDWFWVPVDILDTKGDRINA